MWFTLYLYHKILQSLHLWHAVIIDAVMIHSSKVHSGTIIYLLPFRKSNYLFSFCTINHFVRAAVTFFFFQTVDILFGMKPINAFYHRQAYHSRSTPSCLFSLPLCPLRAPGPVYRPVRQPVSDTSVRAESVCRSLSQSVGRSSLQSQICGGKH